MATCDICNKKIGFLEGTTLQSTSQNFGTGSTISVCDECNEMMCKLKKGDFDAYKYIHEKIDDGGTLSAQTFVSSWEKIPDEIEQQREKERLEEQQKQEEIERIKNELLRKELILTTCPTIEGYTIEEQMGLVFGEVFFKSSLSSRLGASLENFGSALKISATEMSGTASLVEEAREYALRKLQYNAAEKGANAVIGIDAESTLGGDIMHVTIYGTAVKVVKNTL